MLNNTGTPGLLILISIYLIPTMIAAARGHRNLVPIALVNLFAGWTLIGWFVSLVWAFTSHVKKREK